MGFFGAQTCTVKRELRVRSLMRCVLDEIERAPSKGKLYGQLFARYLWEEHRDCLYDFKAELKAAGVSISNKAPGSLKRVKVQRRSRDDDDGDVHAHRPRVRL